MRSQNWCLTIPKLVPDDPKTGAWRSQNWCLTIVRHHFWDRFWDPKYGAWRLAVQKSTDQLVVTRESDLSSSVQFQHAVSFWKHESVTCCENWELPACKRFSLYTLKCTFQIYRGYSYRWVLSVPTDKVEKEPRYWGYTALYTLHSTLHSSLYIHHILYTYTLHFTYTVPCTFHSPWHPLGCSKDCPTHFTLHFTYAGT